MTAERSNHGYEAVLVPSEEEEEVQPTVDMLDAVVPGSRPEVEGPRSRPGPNEESGAESYAVGYPPVSHGLSYIQLAQATMARLRGRR